MGFVDTGAFGPVGTRAWFAYSDQSYDKFKGEGDLNKIQYNAKIYQPIRDNGDFASVAFHWNRNRNNNYNGPNLFANPDGSLGSTADTSPFGWDVDFLPTYTAPTFRNGVADVDSNSTNYWGLRINPSDTGNIRGQSRFSLTDSLRLTIDPSFQYVQANGGSAQSTLTETNSLIRGSRTTGGLDLNGDGDILDTVRVNTPSNTNTQRYGLNASLLWDVNDNHSFRVAYTLDWARHRQTGAYGAIDFSTPTEPRFVDIFGGLENRSNRIVNLDGYYLRARDRLSYAILNQAALEYRGQFFDDRLLVSLGARAPFFKREMNQFCYSQKGSSSVLCTTQTALVSNTSTSAYTYYRFGSATTGTEYVAPYSREVKYDDILPNVNASWNFNDENSVYASYAESMTLPRTDNLYTVLYNAAGELVSPILNPEKTQTYDLGYRYQSGALIAQASVWYTQFQDRILTAYDPETNISTDRNVGDVKMMGVDGSIGWSPIEPLSFYASASYNESDIQEDYRSSATTVIPVGGKALVETPEWTYVLSARFNKGPVSGGVQARYVGERWLTDVNDLEVPSYTVVNADIRFDMTQFGLKGTHFQLNVINLFDEEYYGSLGTGTNALPVTGVAGVSSLFASQGAPQTVQATIRYAF